MWNRKYVFLLVLLDKNFYEVVLYWWRFFVAEDDGYVVGYVLFWIKYENEGHIISLAVDKDYQRKQAGTKLLLKAINVLSLFKINKILLEVNENNEGAIEFYKKFNFEVDRKVPHYYNNGDGAIVMYLPVKV